MNPQFISLSRWLSLGFLMIFLPACVTADNGESNRRYIDSDGYGNTNTIKVSSIDDFQYLMAESDVTVLFRREFEPQSIQLLTKTELFFPAKNGEVYVVDAKGYQSLGDLERGEEAGFPNGTTYYDAIGLDIETFDIYDYYMKNSFIAPEDAKKAYHKGFVNMADAHIPLSAPLQISEGQMEAVIRPLSLAHQSRESAREPPVSYIAFDERFEPVDRRIWMISTGKFPRAAFRNQNSRDAPRIEERAIAIGGSGNSIPTHQFGYLRRSDGTYFYFHELPDNRLLEMWGFTETDLQKIVDVYRGQRNVSRSDATVRLFEESSALYASILLEAFYFNETRPVLDAIVKNPAVDSDWYYSALLLGIETKDEYESVSKAYNNGFINPTDYLQMLDLGFHRKHDYLQARDRGLRNANDLELSNMLATNDISLIELYLQNLKILNDIRALTSQDSYVDCHVYYILSIIDPGAYSVESIKVEMDSYSVNLFYDADSPEFREQRSKWQTGYRTDFSGRTNVLSAIDREMVTVSSGKLHEILASRDWDDFGVYDRERRMFTKKIHGS
jgi:hypothetical protein